MRSLITIGLFERLIHVRGGWVKGYGVAFGLGTLALALVAALAGPSVPGFGFDRTTATVLHLMLMVVPLVSLVLAAGSFAASRGMWEMLASQPISSFGLVAGKWLGVWASVGGVTAAALGCAGLIIAWVGGGAGAGPYVVMGLSGVLLAGSFAGMGAVIGAALPDRSRALAAAVLAWLAFVFLYDWLIIGVALFVGRRLAIGAIWLALVLNPADLARVATVSGLGALDLLGPTGAVLSRSGAWAGLLLWTALGLWTLLPVALAAWLARRVER